MAHLIDDDRIINIGRSLSEMQELSLWGQVPAESNELLRKVLVPLLRHGTEATYRASNGLQRDTASRYQSQRQSSSCESPAKNSCKGWLAGVLFYVQLAGDITERISKPHTGLDYRSERLDERSRTDRSFRISHPAEAGMDN